MKSYFSATFLILVTFATLMMLQYKATKKNRCGLTIDWLTSKPFLGLCGIANAIFGFVGGK
jgi:hypothetical protein